MKRTSAARPHELDTPAKASDDRKGWSSVDDDAATPILVLIIACLIFAILVLYTPDIAVPTADQTLLMPAWGP